MKEFEIRIDEAITTSSHGSVITPEEARRIHELRPENTTGEKITVAIMDSGIDDAAEQNHPWFDGVDVTKRYDATRNGNEGVDVVGHGTGVGSIVAKNVENVELYSVRIFGQSGTGGYPAIERAYQWLLDHGNEIDIVNMSWGARRDIPQINRLHDALMDQGVADVVAAGNTGGDGGSPATAKNAFSAGAIDESEAPTRFSSFDPEKGNPDVAAVGKDVKMAKSTEASMGTVLDNQFIKASGTSFAAPYVAAAYANALQSKRQNWDQVFMDTAHDIPGVKKDGAGILLLEDAVSKKK